MAEWITTAELASLGGLSERRARKLCLEFIEDTRASWQGAALVVKTITGCPGRYGKNYLALLSSLPSDLQARFKALQTLVEGTFNPLPGRSGERSWWLHVLGPALTTHPNTPERAAALKTIAASRHADRHGNPVKLNLRTLQRQMAKLEHGGTGPLVRSVRADRGQRRTFISRAWDKAVPYPDAQKEKLAADLRQYIREWVAEGRPTGQVQFMASGYLARMTAAHGFRMTDKAELDRACAIPKQLVQAEQHLRKTHQRRADHARIENTQPRIKRTIAGFAPMELVVADVHPIDVVLQRSDGGEAHPRLFAFLDLATQRCWCDLIFFEKRGGVRNPDLIASYMAMVDHPAFGLPQQLYVDNGGEFGFADMTDGAMQLAWPQAKRKTKVLHAIAYNAAAKPVEQWFKRFEEQHLSALPGYRGGDRMKSRRKAPGQLTDAFPGSFEDFRRTFFALLRAYEAMPQPHGQLAGMSPSAAFASHVDAGWAAVTMDPRDHLLAFTRPETRVVTQGCISVFGKSWTCPELWAHLGRTVTVHIPPWHRFDGLLVQDAAGKMLGVARPDEEFGYLDPRGAQASATRKKVHHDAIRAAGKTVRRRDIAAELAAIGAETYAVIPNMPKETVRIGSPGMELPRAIAPANAKPQNTKADQIREAEEIRALRASLRPPRPTGRQFG